jgi:hypothetical protein
MFRICLLPRRLRFDMARNQPHARDRGAFEAWNTVNLLHNYNADMIVQMLAVIMEKRRSRKEADDLRMN